MKRSTMAIVSALLLLGAAESAGCGDGSRNGSRNEALSTEASPVPDASRSDSAAAKIPSADTSAARHVARRAVRGDDLEGKDGPLAKVGFDLALLYYRYEAAQARGDTARFAPPGGSMRVTDGGVLVEAIAAEDGAALRADLARLGLEEAAQAGPLVSGLLPIGAIPEAAALPSLRSMQPSRPATMPR